MEWRAKADLSSRRCRLAGCSIFVTLMQGYGVFLKGHWDTPTFIFAYAMRESPQVPAHVASPSFGADVFASTSHHLHHPLRRMEAHQTHKVGNLTLRRCHLLCQRPRGELSPSSASALASHRAAAADHLGPRQSSSPNTSITPIWSTEARSAPLRTRSSLRSFRASALGGVPFRGFSRRLVDGEGWGWLIGGGVYVILFGYSRALSGIKLRRSAKRDKRRAVQCTRPRLVLPLSTPRGTHPLKPTPTNTSAPHRPSSSTRPPNSPASPPPPPLSLYHASPCFRWVSCWSLRWERDWQRGGRGARGVGG